MPFYLDDNPTPTEISGAINYLLGNFVQTVNADSSTGQISGPTGNIVSYLYKYLQVKYADSFDGTLNFSNTQTNRSYYGIRNVDSSIESTNPNDYTWTAVTGGFGTSKTLYYSTTGGRQAQIFVGTAIPSPAWQPDPGVSIDLDVLTAATSVVNFVVYRTANDSTAPTNTEVFNATGRTPIAGDLATINYNAGANSIQYRYSGTTWNVINKYITGDIINNLVGINTPISTAQYEDFNTSLTPPSYLAGRVYYDPDRFALSYYNEANGYDVSIGREIIVRCYNNTGSTLNIGDMVYVNGASSGWPTITKAIATDSVGANSILGMVAKTIANGAYGYVNITGVVHNVNTSAYAAGTVLYLSDTTSGGWTSTMPLQPSYDIRIGTVLFQDASLGRVLVRTQILPWFPSIEFLDSTASVTLPTTPTIYKPPTTTRSDGFTYDSSTGVVTANTSGTFTISIAFNATASASNKNIYFYMEKNIGSGWSPDTYSGKQIALQNATLTQVSTVLSQYIPTGTQLRAYIWGDATVTLSTNNMPGTTAGTVVIPALRATIA